MFQEFDKPATIAEAVALRKQHPTSVYLAGGTEVNGRGWCIRCESGPGPDRAIGIGHLPMGGIQRTDAGVTIGANVVVQDLIEHPDTPPLLAEAARQFANRNIRNMATLGGNLATNKSCSNLIPSLMALDARVHLWTDAGEKSVPVAEHVTQRDAAALITSVVIPRERVEAYGATRKVGRTVNDISVLSVSVAFEGSPACIQRPVVAVGGVARTVTRLPELEKRLEGKSLPGRDDIEAWTKSIVQPIDDLRGSAAYKRQVAAALVAWALHRAATTRGGKA